MREFFLLLLKFPPQKVQFSSKNEEVLRTSKMKKLVVLVSVLAMASWTQATPFISGPSTIDVTPGSIITLTLSGTVAEASGGTAGNSNTPMGGYTGFIWVDYYAYKGQLSNVVNVALPYTGIPDGPFDLTGLPDNFKFTAISDPVWSEDTDIDEGPWFTFDLGLDSTPTVGEVYNVQMLDPAFNVEATHTVTVVPEPMTIALLGLGGLALLIKRRA